MCPENNVVEAALFRNALSRFASGVTVVTIPDESELHGVRGITASAFLSVSLSPPLVLVSIDQKARAHRPFLTAERYGVSILAAGQEGVSNHFAGRNPGLTPEFAELGGYTVVAGACAQLACRVYERHPAGDHTLFIGEVEAVRTFEQEPLLYHRGHYGRFS